MQEGQSELPVTNAASLHVHLTQSVIEPASLLARVRGTGNGAAILFLGTVRDNNDGRAVEGIEYSAYRAMAEKILREIASEAQLRYKTGAIALEHRIGTLQLGDISVAIAVSHPHRGEAFDASRYIIEELKKRVPIWKQEHYSDGTREWVDPTATKEVQVAKE